MSKILLIFLIIIFILILLSLMGLVRFRWSNEDTATSEYPIFATTCKYIGIAVDTRDRVIPILPIKIFCMAI